MQFKYPELLWALFLLLVPLFIHLFQLRKFKKTPFTNVKVLQKVQVESRKTRNLKKWLLLFTRLLIFAGIILAFAQPFFAQKGALKQKETVIYLDNSFSMQAKNNDIDLLKDATQELIKNLRKENQFSLFTNSNTYKNTSLKDIQNDLLSLKYTNNQLSLHEISIKANTIFSSKNNTEKDLIIISDFQQAMGTTKIDSATTVHTHFIKLNPNHSNNISIDSAYISKIDAENMELTATLLSSTATENIAVSLYNKDQLFAKTSALFNQNKTATVIFTLPKNTAFDGKIEVLDKALSYDNQLFFTINKKEKIKVLVISESDSDYLDRIFTEDEFALQTVALKQLNYSTLENQNLIVLNELVTLPESLINSLHSFTTNGGSLVVVPAIQSTVAIYNKLLGSYYSTAMSSSIPMARKITDIAFSHPLYKNVFEKNITNFQYPTVQSYFPVKTTAPTLLNFDNQAPFLVGANGFYFFTAALSKEHSNFKNAPLIVPTFYTMGSSSLKLPQLYNVVGVTTKVDIETPLENDNILKLTKGSTEYIPLQQSFATKITLTLNDVPDTDGIYTVNKGDSILNTISLNYPRKESVLTYLDVHALDASTTNESITKLFQNLENKQKVSELWKWFVIFAMFFLVLEVLIQKYLS
ncbi:BatA and WFA domain-containing protein [Cellulophaga sp. F20128]|uniref:vWA domain-containing protein n=1 Tax=Cellulophaga sp. F20128 TaxID=2926413 RepID=UPI001FF19467|nr:BatA and WFA domain-containing protein [Cellulophaga sp. F20128]MCK0156682.1 BatA and WFA domain-containing protein [Cellulophaga sp. F20128]